MKSVLKLTATLMVVMFSVCYVKATSVLSELSLKNVADGEITIIKPRFVNPEFAMPGGVIIAEVKADTLLAADGFSVTISNDLRSWTCSVSATITNINLGMERGWKLTVTLPANTPPELFTLNISHSAGQTDSEFGAVSVVKDFETSFYILQTTDEQIQTEHVLSTEPNGYRCGDAVKWLATVANIINPRFIAITGDLVEDGWSNTTAKYGWYTTAKKDYTVPSLIIRGNNDMCDPATYESLMGQRSFSNKLGSFYVITNDFNGDGTNLLPWVQSDYDAAWADNSIKYRLILQHYHFDGERSFNPSTDKPCNLMLMGHIHENRIDQTTPYYKLGIISAGDEYMKSGFFNFEKTALGWNCTSDLANHASGANIITPLGDWGAPNVSASYTGPNDGTQLHNKVTIINKINCNFYDGRVRFLMSNGTYTVTGGEVIAEYTYDGDKLAVLVTVDIQPGTTSSPSTKTVTIITTDPSITPVDAQF